MYRYLVIFVILVLAGCKAAKIPVENENGFIGNATSSTCKVKGKILSILPDSDDDTTTMCGIHPCFAKVEILELSDCGAAATLPYKSGDVVTMRFIHTLQPTKNIFPTMKPRFPGLRRGDMFQSMAENKKDPDRNNTFIITSYLRLF